MNEWKRNGILTWIDLHCHLAKNACYAFNCNSVLSGSCDIRWESCRIGRRCRARQHLYWKEESGLTTPTHSDDFRWHSHEKDKTTKIKQEYNSEQHLAKQQWTPSNFQTTTTTSNKQRQQKEIKQRIQQQTNKQINKKSNKSATNDRLLPKKYSHLHKQAKNQKQKQTNKQIRDTKTKICTKQRQDTEIQPEENTKHIILQSDHFFLGSTLPKSQNSWYSSLLFPALPSPSNLRLLWLLMAQTK